MDSEFTTNKFIEYQHKAKSVYLDFLLNYLVDKRNLDVEKIFLVLFFFCYTYSEIDAIYIFETIDSCRLWDKKYILDYFSEHEKNISFCSARVKSKNKRIFQESCESYLSVFQSEWVGGILENIVSKNMWNKLKCINALEKRVLRIRNIWDFSSRKFIEVVEYLWRFGGNKLLSYFENTSKVDWFVSKNMTLWALRCMWEKDIHDKFAESGTLETEEIKKLNWFLAWVSEQIKEYQNWELVSQNVFLQKLCSFENLYKSKRYWGYHHDRQLINIRNKEKNNVGNDFVNRMFFLRKKSYSKTMLGEVGGREWYRNPMKYLRIEKGRTGVE